MKARKRFGQHFLTDEGVIDGIVAAVAPGTDDRIVEIGPGRAALTQPLAALTDHLTLIELDRDLLPILRAAFPAANVVSADVLRVRFSEVADVPCRLVGNLPYNISSPLILHVLAQLGDIQDMHFMVQREMALRLAARPGSKAWGRLSVQVQYRCEVSHLFDVPPTAFSPPPKVDSSVIRLLPKTPELPLTDEGAFDEVLRTVFSARRKRLANSLKSLDVDWLWQELSVNEDARAEQVTVADFVLLANQLAAAQGSA